MNGGSLLGSVNSISSPIESVILFYLRLGFEYIASNIILVLHTLSVVVVVVVIFHPHWVISIWIALDLLWTALKRLLRIVLGR
jgi:hypothetical protein